MTYILRYKYDHKEPQKVCGLPFATKREAIISGQGLLAAATGWDLEVIDEKGNVVASESEVRDG